jgi:hypothetical protein
MKHFQANQGHFHRQDAKTPRKPKNQKTKSLFYFMPSLASWRLGGKKGFV